MLIINKEDDDDNAQRDFLGRVYLVLHLRKFPAGRHILLIIIGNHCPRTILREILLGQRLGPHARQ